MVPMSQRAKASGVSSRLTFNDEVTRFLVIRQSYSKRLPRDWSRRARVFSALGEEHRQRILLMFDRGESLTISQIVAATPLSRTSVTYHLKILIAAGVLRARKEGSQVYLRPDADTVVDAMTGLLDYVRSVHG